MIDPFTLFQPPPTPPVGVATWTDLQLLDAARAQAAWAAEQAYWARFGAWTQLAAFVAAGAAAIFTLVTARHARVQAEAAHEQLNALNSAKAVESTVQAWAMWAFLDKTFSASLRSVTEPRDIPSSLVNIVKGSSTGLNWNQMREDGVRITAGINSSNVLPSWIDLLDVAVQVYRTGVDLAKKRAVAIGAQPGTLLVYHDPTLAEAQKSRDNRWLREAESDLRDAQRLRDDFWRRYELLMAELDWIGRGGNFHSGHVGGSATTTGDLSVGVITP
jgi:hypothetical protein